ncbi:NADH-quinone oxidoreductase subunit H [SAR202 cluster bacterium AD-804-J14_MRT_500m]|nr:NADH-quinone oxidoreductase subunit H [SAR202 cluster bacterium AD-804-J14_MRT_500m]
MNIGEILRLLMALFILFTALSVVVLSLVWIERKFLGRLQRRLGPTRTGPFGLMQPVADAVKLVVKEDLIPSWADKAIFWVAPLLVIIPSFMIWVTIPAAQGLVLRNLDLGLFVVVALLVLSILGIVLAGWGSANKYGALGGLRSAAQLISYEVPLVMVVVSLAIIAESLDLRIIAASQVPIGTAQNVLVEAAGNGASFNHVGLPFALIFPLGLVLFLIAGLAEVGRTPFDIYFAESEIVGGPFVEYSGAHWSVFFLAEYINTFVIAALTALLFLGGWYGPGLPPWVWFLLKTYMIVLVIFWIRGTFPRLRIDQLMAFGWKCMIPLSFIGVVMVSVYRFYDWPDWSLSLMSVAVLVAVSYGLYRRFTQPVIRLAQKYGRQLGRPANVS